MDPRDVNRKLALASILVFITVITIVFDRLTGCSREEKTKVVEVEPPKTPPSEEPPPIKDPRDNHLSTDEVEQAALEDASRPQLNAADRENYRYLSLADLYDQGLDLDTPALGVHKTINQISSQRFLKMAVAIDKNRAIYRIDLRDYFGSRGRDIWRKIEQALVIRIVSKTVRNQTLQFLTGAVVPIVHARVFVETVLTGNLYYDILGIPAKIGDFYKNFAGVVPQVEFDNKDPGVFLAGTFQSQLAQNNRLAWRIEGAQGAVYQTFDVDDGNVAAAQNLLENPFVAEVNPDRRVLLTNKIFKHAASEVLGFLPNGMMFGALFDAAGNRQVAAPQTVVSNYRAVSLGLSSLISNMRDCTGCHQSGYIAIRDEIGANIRQSTQFNATEKELGKNFFVRQAVIDAFMAQDNSLYAKALADISISGGPDPINEGLLDEIRTGVDAKEAASFFYLEEEEFLDLLRGSTNVSREVGSLLRGGVISFQQFVNSVPRIVDDLNLFEDID